MSDRPTDVTPGSNVPSGADRAASAAEKGVNIEVPTSTLKLTSHAPTVEVGSAYVAASVGLAAGSSSAAAVSVVDRGAAILALEPKFQALPATILHAIVAEAEPAGPHLENPDFPEELLRALGTHEQDRRATEQLKHEATNARRWSLAEKVLLVVVSGAVGAIITWAGLS